MEVQEKTKAVSTYEYRRYDRKSLLPVLAPKNVAVIGASEKPASIGRTLLWNLISNPFGGTVFPVNPNRSSILGIKPYPNLAAITDPVDLAVIATPAETVPDIIDECADAGVKGGLIISSGFREIGVKGAELEKEILQRAQRGGMRFLGPNCYGIMMPYSGFNASIGRGMALTGNVGFISQSGAISAAILDWSFRERVGFSGFISIGNMSDINWGDLIYYMGDDHHTHSIVIYLERVGDARTFLSAAREVSLTKPIIVLYGGEHHAEMESVGTQISRLVASQEPREQRSTSRVLNAAFRRSGVLPVKRMVDLFAMAEILFKQPRAEGPRLTILTNSHAPGVQAGNALVNSGGKLAPLSEETVKELSKLFLNGWKATNPINILRDADPDRYVKTLEIVSKDPNNNGILVILTPQAMTDPTETARRLKPFAKLSHKPILVSWMGGEEVAEGKALLNRFNVPTFPFPDTAAQAFNYMWQHNYNLRGLFETPELPADDNGALINRGLATGIINSVRESGRNFLTDVESKQVLSAYGIPVLPTELATSEEEALEVAERTGYPVLLKVCSEGILDRSIPGYLNMNLINAESVVEAFRSMKKSVTEKMGPDYFKGVTVQPMLQISGYKLIVGCCQDKTFGPVLLFGAGGSLVEIHQDIAIGLPPLNSTLAHRMMEQTRIYHALRGEKGLVAINMAELEQLLVRFSQLVVEQRWIKEIEINPLLAGSHHLTVSDSRMVLQTPDIEEEDIPRLAIRPYPSQYIQTTELRDGTPVIIRPIRPEDESLIAKFHETLSDQSVYFRYFHPIALKQRVSHERLSRICFIDYDREVVLVVIEKDPKSGEQTIIAVGRINKLRGTNDAEFAITISDKYQRTGLGTVLLDQLVQIGRVEKVDRIVADILMENRGMQRVCEKVGFKLRYDGDEQIVKAVIELQNGN
jgi:acetyltransferase